MDGQEVLNVLPPRIVYRNLKPHAERLCRSGRPLRNGTHARATAPEMSTRPI
jgi:hypothetical protein